MRREVGSDRLDVGAAIPCLVSGDPSARWASGPGELCAAVRAPGAACKGVEATAAAIGATHPLHPDKWREAACRACDAVAWCSKSDESNWSIHHGVSMERMGAAGARCAGA